ncbi:MAG: PadR family transcriptional regulator [Syntrophomonas sp.]
MPRINKTRYALLGALSVRPGSGYDIKKFCDRSIAFFWTENYAQIYPVLKQLEQEGLVYKETENTPGRPPRNVYHITEEGRAELNDWLLLPVEPSNFRWELLLKLLFSGDIPTSNIIEKLEKKKSDESKILNYVNEVEEKMKSAEPDRKGWHLWLAAVRAGKHLSQASIAWCDETIAMLREYEIENGNNE